jgi:hypothetical protein
MLKNGQNLHAWTTTLQLDNFANLELRIHHKSLPQPLILYRAARDAIEQIEPVHRHAAKSYPHRRAGRKVGKTTRACRDRHQNTGRALSAASQTISEHIPIIGPAFAATHCGAALLSPGAGAAETSNPWWLNFWNAKIFENERPRSF